MAEPQRVADSEALPLRMKWRQTWPDREADYEALTAEGLIVGRIYRYPHDPQQGQWFWAMNADSPEVSRNIGKLYGVEASPRSAAHMVEDAWFTAIKGSALDRPTPKVNPYAMVKAGE